MNRGADDQDVLRDQATQIDVSANRAAREWSSSELLGRLLCELTTPFFSFSPRLVWGWRRWLLRLFGARIGKHVHIYPSVRIAVASHLSMECEVAVPFTFHQAVGQLWLGLALCIMVCFGGFS